MFFKSSKIISVVLGEGASGGALGIGVTDRIICFENTWYSVISPEGCASILFRDAARASEAADAMKVTAHDLLEMKISDEIIPEPSGGAHMDYDAAANELKKVVIRELKILLKKPRKELIDDRMDKFESMGKWETYNE